MKQLLESSRRLSPARFPFKLLLFGASGAVAFAYGFLAHSPAKAGLIVQQAGYYTIAITFGWWVCSLLQIADVGPARVKDWFRENRSAILAAGIFTMIAVLTTPYSLKILYDELVLQATASNLHFFREFGTITRGYEVEGVFRSLEVYVDKRPIFYPFLVSVLHDISGFRSANGQLLNTVLLPVTVLLTYAVLKKIASPRAALVGIVFFGGSSLLAQNANGGGMELLNVVMFLATVLLASAYLQQPTGKKLTALVLSSVLLAQTRYESALFVVPTALVILEGWRRIGSIVLPAAGLFAPLLLIPCALHNIYLSGTPALWELREDTTTRFSDGYLLDNLEHAAFYFFVLSGVQLNSWWLAAAGLPALVGALVAIVRRRRAWRTAAPAFAAVVAFGATVVVNFWILMFYYWGQLDDPIVARLILPFNVVLTFAGVWALSQLPSIRQERLAPWLIGAGAVCYAAFGLRATAQNLSRNELATEITWEETWVESLPSRPRLMISNKSPLSWLVRKMSSISIPRARNVAENIRFHLLQRTFEEVLVSQYYRPTGPDGDFQLDPRDVLPASYVLEPLIERRMGMRLLRISRVVEIDIPAPPAKPTEAGPPRVSMSN